MLSEISQERQVSYDSTHVESNEQNELSKIVTNLENRLTALVGGGQGVVRAKKT